MYRSLVKSSSSMTRIQSALAARMPEVSCSRGSYSIVQPNDMQSGILLSKSSEPGRRIVATTIYNKDHFIDLGLGEGPQCPLGALGRFDCVWQQRRRLCRWCTTARWRHTPHCWSCFGPRHEAF